MYTSQSIGTQVRSLNFAPALGSLGATIGPGQDGCDDEEGTKDDESVRTLQFNSSEGVELEDAFAIMEVPREEGSDLVLAF